MSEPVQPRPEPVVQAAQLAGNVAGVVGGLAGIFATLAAVTHWQWAVATAAALTAVSAALAKWMPYITALGARAQVTPLEAPQAMDGSPLHLAPAGDYSPSMGPDLP